MALHQEISQEPADTVGEEEAVVRMLYRNQGIIARAREMDALLKPPFLIRWPRPFKAASAGPGGLWATPVTGGSIRVQVPGSRNRLGGALLGVGFHMESPGDWRCGRLRGGTWVQVGDAQRVRVRNRYRVLLTRARYGLLVWVPKPQRDVLLIDRGALEDTAEALVTAGCEPL